MESVTQAVTPKFEIGDRVRRVGTMNTPAVPVGSTGTVTELKTGVDACVIVEWDHDKTFNTGNFPCYLEKLSTPHLKVGDTVRIVKSPCTWEAAFSQNQLVTVTDIQPDGAIETSGTDHTHGTTIVQSLHRNDYEALKGLADTLKESYPHGHPDFIPDMLKIMELHSAKNHDYASGGDALGNFDRVADLKRLYPGFPWDSPFGVAWGNMLKQFDAVMWGMAKNIEHKVEGLDARLQDIIVYSAIGRLILRRGTK